MITITFQPETPAQAAVLGLMMASYLMAGTNSDPVETAPVAAAQPEPVAEDVPAKKPRAAKPAAVTPPVTEAAPVEVAPPAPVADSPSKGVTLVDVRAKLASLSQAGKADSVKELLKKYGATKLTEVAEESYALLLDDAEALA